MITQPIKIHLWSAFLLPLAISCCAERSAEISSVEVQAEVNSEETELSETPSSKVSGSGIVAVVNRERKKAPLPLYEITDPLSSFPIPENEEFSVAEVLSLGGGGGAGYMHTSFRKRVSLNSISYDEFMKRLSASLHGRLKELGFHPDGEASVSKRGVVYSFSIPH